LVDEPNHAVDQRLPGVIADLTERDPAPEVLVRVRVAAGTSQRTLARDLDGEGRTVALENAAPGREESVEEPFHPSIVCGHSRPNASSTLPGRPTKPP